MKVKRWMMAALLVCLCGGMNAQEKAKPFMRLGVGTSLYPRFMRGLGGNIEAGLHYKGMEFALNLTLYNSDPIRRDERLAQESINAWYGDREWKDPVVKALFERSNFQSTSLCFTFGYDVLRLIPRNEKHHLILSVGVGWSGENNVETYYNMDEANERAWRENEHTYNPSLELPLGAKYEYSLNERWGVGVTYKMHYVMGRDFFGAHAVYHF